jgi:hypothetical protein
MRVKSQSGVPWHDSVLKKVDTVVLGRVSKLTGRFRPMSARRGPLTAAGVALHVLKII